MRWTTRRALGLSSIALTLILMLAVSAFALFDSEYGKAFLERQTEALVGRLLGPGYSATIGRQSLDLGASGVLMVHWTDVEVKRENVDAPQARVGSIAVGLDPLPLLGGRVEVRSLVVDGVDVDVTQAPESAEVAAAARGLAPADGSVPITPPVGEKAAKLLLPALAERLLGQAEHQLGALQRLGIRDVTLSNMNVIVPIAPGGGPFATRVEHLELDLDDPRAMTLSGLIGVDRASLPIEARIDFDPQAGRLVSGSSTLGPIDLGRLLPPAARDDTRDMRPFGSDADLTLDLTLDPRASDARRSVGIGLALGPGQIQQGRGHIDIKSAALAFDYVEGDDRITVGTNRIVGDGVDLVFAGAIAPIYDKPGEGSFNGFGFDIGTTTMSSSVGKADGKPVLAELKLSGRTDLAAREARLGDLDLRSAGGSLKGSAVYRFAGEDAGVDLHVAAADLPATSVKAFWPFTLAVGARRWVEANIGDEGRVVEGTIALKASKERFAEATRPNQTFLPGELEVSFALEGLRVQAFGGIPDLVGTDGTVETHGSDTLVTVGKARVDGVPDAAVDGGLVSLSRVPEATIPPRSEVKIVVNMSGKAAGLLEIAARPPLNALSALPFASKDVVGSAKAVADVDLLIGDDVPPDHLLKAWHVSVDLDDAGIAKPVSGRRIADLDGTLDVVPGRIEGKVKGSVDGAKGEVSFKRSLDPEPPEGRRMEISVRTDGAEAAKLAPVLRQIVSGPVEARLVEDASAHFKADIDLSSSALTLPWIGWRKGKGVDANLGFALSTREAGMEISDILLKGEGFSVSGRATADKDGIRSAELGSVALNPGDDVRAKLERVQNGFSIDIRGAKFDARPLLADLRGDLGAKTAAPPKEGSEQLDVSAAVDTVLGFGGESVGGFSLNYAGSGSRVAALSITGTARRNTPFTIDVSPRGKDRSVEVRTEDAGALADFAGAYAHMEGGKLSLSLLGSYDDGYAGKLTAKNFTLVDEPRLSRLVASPPAPNSQSLAQAVGRDLTTERASFDHASADIKFGKSGLQLANGIIRGPIFGSSFAGTVYDPQNRIDITGSFMPAYGLNRVFGAIPVVGQLLGNGREGGLIGITYRLSGQVSAPKLEINPISAIAPGIFRNIFAYQ